MTFLNDFFNLSLFDKDIEPRYGRTRTKGFFSTARVVSFAMCLLFIYLLKQFIYKIFRVVVF